MNNNLRWKIQTKKKNHNNHQQEIEQNKRWYKKAELNLNHINEFSKKVCDYPGFCLSIDEMTKLFKGRSHQTVQTRYKPIKEGFKYYVIYDSTTGFVLHFMPNRYKDKHKGTVVDCVMQMVKILPDRKILSTCGKKQIYVVAMNNYFTYGKTFFRCREEGVGMFGTARVT